jgi:DNA replication protein DnaC
MPHIETLPLLLKQLRLPTVTQYWMEFQKKADHNGWSCAEYLVALCELEVTERESRRISRYVRESKLIPGKSLASFDFNRIDSSHRIKIEALAKNPDWVHQNKNLLLFGASGMGKTHIASAIGHSLVEQGIRLCLYNATVLVQQLQKARQELQLEKLLSKLDKYEVIIMDDIGYVKKNEMESHVLFEFIAHRYERKSLIITANQPFADWENIFSDHIMTVAAIDRLVHHATIIELNGESYRRHKALINNEKPEC